MVGSGTWDVSASYHGRLDDDNARKPKYGLG